MSPVQSQSSGPTEFDFAALAAELTSKFGDRFTRAEAVRDHHGHDESFWPTRAPDGVVFPRTTEEVADIARACTKHNVPMIPFGAGTALEGHVAAVSGGLSIDLSEMNQILDVAQEDMLATVQAGVRRKQLNENLRDTGLFFSVDPGADATLGGMCATGASGTTTVRYGTMRENVKALTIVTPAGDIVRTGSKARKSSAGYDITRLIIGSEGTLGIITEVTVRLFGQPEAKSAAICAFNTLKGAVDTVIETIQMGLGVARIELLDPLQIRACNAYSGLTLEEKPTLFLEFHGSPEAVDEQTNLFGELAAPHGGGNFQWATLEEARNHLWTARHNAYYAAQRLFPGKQAFSTDVCVPISRLTQCILDTEQDMAERGIEAPLLGHVGDGNFHLILLVDANDPEDMKRVHDFNERLIDRALSMGGTCSGEHGIGLGKMKWLRKEHGDNLALMRAIKSAFDPKGLMNPGKIFDAVPENN